MWYIIQDEDRIELEIGSTDIFDYEGEIIYCDDENTLVGGVAIDDTFIIDYGWFEDTEDWPKINAYRKGMNCSVQDAFDQWEETYIGKYRSEAAFSEFLHSELTDDLPTFLRSNIDWQGVWDSTDRHDYFEQDGYFFQNL